MTQDEFSAVIVRTKLERESRAVCGAQLVLVEGISDPEAATRVGCSRQAVGVARRKIIAAAKICPACGRYFEKTDAD